MDTIIGKTIRDIALEAPATTRVFEEFKIDYCCGGRRSIDDVCLSAGIDPEVLTQRINAVIAEQSNGVNTDHPEQKAPSDLIGYILSKHHVFTAEEIARLTPLMNKVATRHGENHPELFELQSVFDALADSLIPHMRKEEAVLFPYIQMLEESAKHDLSVSPPHFGSVQNPIRMMMSEHDTDGERLQRMRSITGDYTLPEGACPSFTALYAGLQDLERDLHRHIHLENNVLFPAAAALETKANAVSA
ncbi:MAG: iron-sulfur cluster repair di-iron protein [Pyrinomonadaceae bacterium]